MHSGITGNPVRVAVVGMGLMGMLHARILKSFRDVTLVGIVEIDEERRKAASTEFDVPGYGDLAEILSDVDAVSITLPDELHVAACVEALRANKYVLVEKPLATNEADARTILAAQPAPDRLMVGQLLRFDLRLAELKRRMDTGELGKIEFIKVHRANGRAAVARLKGRCSVTAFLGVHDLDLLLWLAGGSIAHVQAMGSKVFTDKWDLSLAHLRLDNGIIASVENHWLINAASARSALAGIQVFGDKGQAVLDLSTDELELATDSLGATRRIDSRNWTHDGGVSGGSLRRELESWVGAIRDGAAMPVSGEDGLNAVIALNQVEAALDASDKS